MPVDLGALKCPADYRPGYLHNVSGIVNLQLQAGGELEQIQFLLGHASVQTTERYIGCRQNLREAVNDRFEISLRGNAKRKTKEGPR
jgi:integrase